MASSFLIHPTALHQRHHQLQQQQPECNTATEIWGQVDSPLVIIIIMTLIPETQFDRTKQE